MPANGSTAGGTTIPMYDVDRVGDQGDALVAHGSRVWPVLIALGPLGAGMLGIAYLTEGRWFHALMNLCLSVTTAVQVSGLWRGLRVDERGVRTLGRFRPIPWNQIVAVEARNYGVEIELARKGRRVATGLPERFLPRVLELRAADFDRSDRADQRPDPAHKLASDATYPPVRRDTPE